MFLYYMQQHYYVHSLYYIKLKTENLSICLSAFWFWVDKSIMAAWINVRLARCQWLLGSQSLFFKCVRAFWVLEKCCCRSIFPHINLESHVASLKFCPMCHAIAVNNRYSMKNHSLILKAHMHYGLGMVPPFSRVWCCQP